MNQSAMKWWMWSVMGMPLVLGVASVGFAAEPPKAWTAKWVQFQGSLSSEGRVWVEGDKVRVEEPSRGGGKNIQLYDGIHLYTFEEGGAVAIRSPASRSNMALPGDSQTRRVKGKVNALEPEQVDGRTCRVQSFIVQPQPRIDSTEWMAEDTGLVMKTTWHMSKNDWGNELVGWKSVEDVEDSLFILPKNLQVRAQPPFRVTPDYFEGKPVEPFSMKVSGQALTLTLHEVCKSYKAVVLNFTATWCYYCKVETPDMVKVYGEYRDRGVTFLSVNKSEEGDREGKIAAYVKEYGVPWPILLDVNQYTDVYAHGIPVNMVLDSSGKILAYKIGKTDAAWFRQKLDLALGEKSPPSSGE